MAIVMIHILFLTLIFFLVISFFNIEKKNMVTSILLFFTILFYFASIKLDSFINPKYPSSSNKVVVLPASDGYNDFFARIEEVDNKVLLKEAKNIYLNNIEVDENLNLSALQLFDTLTIGNNKYIYDQHPASQSRVQCLKKSYHDFYFYNIGTKVSNNLVFNNDSLSKLSNVKDLFKNESFLRIDKTLDAIDSSKKFIIKVMAERFNDKFFIKRGFKKIQIKNTDPIV